MGLTYYLKAKTQTNTVFNCELMFAEDAEFCAQTESMLQEMCDTFSASCQLFGLQVSVQKTVAHAPNTPTPYIEINGETLKVVDKFCYLDSMTDESANLITKLAAVMFILTVCWLGQDSETLNNN